MFVEVAIACDERLRDCEAVQLRQCFGRTAVFISAVFLPFPFPDRPAARAISTSATAAVKVDSAPLLAPPVVQLCHDGIREHLVLQTEEVWPGISVLVRTFFAFSDLSSEMGDTRPDRKDNEIALQHLFLTRFKFQESFVTRRQAYFEGIFVN